MVTKKRDASPKTFLQGEGGYGVQNIIGLSVENSTDSSFVFFLLRIKKEIYMDKFIKRRVLERREEKYWKII